MPTTVTMAGTVAANLDNAVPGALDWSSTTEALTSNNLYAFVSFTAAGGTSKYLYVSTFSMNLPTTAVVEGITASLDRLGAGAVQDYYVALAYDTGTSIAVTSPGKQQGGNWPVSETTTTYGAANDTWNRTWTPAEINDTDFGFVVAIQGTAGSPSSGAVDFVQLAVVYHQLINITASGGISGGGSGTNTMLFATITASGGGVVSGHGGTNIDVTITAAGVRGNGSGSDSSYYGALGGTLAGGAATWPAIYRISPTGAILANGTSPFGKQFLWEGSGGVVAGGSSVPFTFIGATGGAVVAGAATWPAIYNPATYNPPFYNPPTLAFGARVNGTAGIDPYIATGGVLGNSSSVVMVLFMPSIVSAGIQANGTATVFSQVITSGGTLTAGAAVIGIQPAITGGGVCAGLSTVDPSVASGGILGAGEASVFPWVPQGGIRGSGSGQLFQVYNLSAIRFAIGLYGSHVVPAVATLSNGWADIYYDETTNFLSWRIYHNVASATQIAIRGAATPQQNAGIQVNVGTISGTASPSIGGTTILEIQEQGLLNGTGYIQILNGSGDAVRGQLWTQGSYLNGTPHYDEFVTMVGGSTVGGNAEITVTYRIPTSGTCFVAVKYTFAQLADSKFATGGSVGGGSITFQFIYNLVATGGAKAAGQANFPAIFNVTASGGLVAGGAGVPGIQPAIFGGAVGGGTAVRSFFIIPAISGGVKISGAANHTLIIVSLLATGGARCAGKARVERFRDYSSSRRGYGAAMASQNILTVQEDTSTKLLDPIRAESPELDEHRFRIQHDPGWCDVVEKCEEGTLPKVVQNRQGDNLPPKIGQTSRRDRAFASLS